MITEELVIQWMRRRIAEGGFDTAAGLAGEFLREHQINDALSQDFSCVISAGFKLAPEIASHKQDRLV